MHLQNPITSLNLQKCAMKQHDTMTELTAAELFHDDTVYTLSQVGHRCPAAGCSRCHTEDDHSDGSDDVD